MTMGVGRGSSLRQQKSIPPPMGRQPKPPRPPPRLRTKTGCLTCRTRRKKCDETSGVCLGCSRNSLVCIWPDHHAGCPKDSSNKSQDSAYSPQSTPSNAENVPSPVSVGSLSNALEVYDGSRNSTPDLSWNTPNWLSPIFTSPEALSLFQYFMAVFTPPLIHANAHQGFSDHSYIFSMALEIPSLMDTFLACSALRLSYDQKGLLPEALRHYSAAISTTRRMIDNDEVQGTEDWLVVMTIFLCLFERWQIGPSKAITHLQGAGQLLALRRANLNSSTKLITPFHRISAESVLYNTTISTLLCDDIHWLSYKKLWGQISSYFESGPYPDASDIANSPILGVSPKLYRLVLEISCLARYEPLPFGKHTRLVKIEAEMKSWLPHDDTIKAITTWKHKLDTDGHLNYCYGATIALAADILLFKMLHPDANDNNSYVQNRVQQVLTMLKQTGPDDYHIDILCWPILVVGCASVLEEDFAFLLHRLDVTWRRSYLGDTLRAANIIKTVWRERNMGAYERGEVYGIDLFLRRDRSLSEFM